MLSKIWPFCLLLPAPKLEFVNGIPRSPQAEQTFRKFWDMSAEEIEALPVDPELEKVFETFEEMSEVIENASYPQNEDRVDYWENMEDGAEYLYDFMSYMKNLTMCEIKKFTNPLKTDLVFFFGNVEGEAALQDDFVPYVKSPIKIQWHGEVQGRALVRDSGQYSTSQQNITIFEETEICQSPMCPKSEMEDFQYAMAA